MKSRKSILIIFYHNRQMSNRGSSKLKLKDTKLLLPEIPDEDEMYNTIFKLEGLDKNATIIFSDVRLGFCITYPQFFSNNAI